MGDDYPRNWENISENFDRLRVPGGWLVWHYTVVIVQAVNYRVSECMVFVPDPGNDWVLKPK